MTQNHHLPSSPVRSIAITAVIGLALAITGCGDSTDTAGEDSPGAPPTSPADASSATGAPETGSDDAPADTDQAEVEGFGTAEVTFLGETTVFEADGPYSCRAYNYGDEQDPQVDIDFGGLSEAGDEFNAGWSNDSPESATARYLAAGADEWWNTELEPVMEAALTSDHTAEITADLYSYTADGPRTETLTATLTCPPVP